MRAEARLTGHPDSDKRPILQSGHPSIVLNSGGETTKINFSANQRPIGTNNSADLAFRDAIRVPTTFPSYHDIAMTEVSHVYRFGRTGIDITTIQLNDGALRSALCIKFSSINVPTWGVVRRSQAT